MNTRSSTRNHRQRRSGATGFTLLEVLITLAVLAVLALSALPAAGERMERLRLQTAAEALLSDLYNARLEAAQSGQTLHVEVVTGPAWCWSVSTQAGCDCGAPARCQLHRVSSADHPGIVITEAQGVSLGPTAGATRSTVAVLESRHGERVQVGLSALGRPQVCAKANNSAMTQRLPHCN